MGPLRGLTLKGSNIYNRKSPSPDPEGVKYL